MRKIITISVFCIFNSILTNAQTCNSGKLDPRIDTLLKNFLHDLTPGLNKISLEQIQNDRLRTDSLYPQKDVERIKIGNTIPLLVFNATHEKNLPLIIYYHPGGFVTPLLPGMEPGLWKASLEYHAIVVAVDYRIAPEFKFPAAVDDAYNAFKWIAENGSQFGGDTAKVIVWGLSAGANLAAVVCQKAKKEGIENKIKLQILNCPSLDDVRNNEKHFTYKEFEKGYFLTKQFMLFSQSAYAGENNFENPEVSPLLSKNVSGLPPMVMITAEFDILRDEADLYTKKLNAAGVKVWSKCFPGQIHCLVGLPPGAEEFKEVNELTKIAMRETMGYNP